MRLRRLGPGNPAVGERIATVEGRLDVLIGLQKSGPAGGFVTRRWPPGEDTAVRLADALDYEHGGRRLVELAERLGHSEAAVRQQASRLLQHPD